MAEWVAAGAMLASAAIAGYGAYDSHEQQEKALEEQRKAQAKAELEQQNADRKAELQRLEGLKTSAEKTDYGNIWGADSAKYADAAQKLSAGTGSFDTDDDETNPFYQKGLL